MKSNQTDKCSSLEQILKSKLDFKYNKKTRKLEPTILKGLERFFIQSGMTDVDLVILLAKLLKLGFYDNIKELHYAMDPQICEHINEDHIREAFNNHLIKTIVDS